MAYVIAKGCIECGRCIRVCSFEGIRKRYRTSIIDPDKCTGCEACVGECLLELIIPDFMYEPWQLSWLFPDIDD